MKSIRDLKRKIEMLSKENAEHWHPSIDDYLSDKEMNVKTLAVRIGTKKALYIGSISTSIGFLFSLYGVYSS